MKYLPRYTIRSSFSPERMTYIAEESKVFYRPDAGREEKVFGILEWITAMCSHVPNEGEQMIHITVTTLTWIEANKNNKKPICSSCLIFGLKHSVVFFIIYDFAIGSINKKRFFIFFFFIQNLYPLSTFSIIENFIFCQ